jgi:CHAT domain
MLHVMERVTILFLAANPKATSRLALDEEAREIEHKIRVAEHRDAFELVTQWAVRPDDLLQAFMQHEPHVVHFSGHGTGAEGLMLAGDDGTVRPVSGAALGHLFRTLKDRIRVVVLNACHSRVLAEDITQHIDCVVGMKRAVKDVAAIRFAASFYRGLAFGRSVQNAFDQGITSLMLEGIAGTDIPELVVRAGVDADRVVLVPGATPAGS